MSIQNDHELLLELVEFKNRQEKRDKIYLILRVVLVVLVAIALIIVVPKALELINTLNDTLAKVNSVTTQIESTFNNLDSEELIQQINQLSGILSQFSKYFY